MKFLCVPCDAPMRLLATDEREPGSLSVVYACPECGYEMAMLTNAQETQMVRSLGVRIGPAASAQLAAPADGTPTDGAPAAAKCPFPAMLGMSLEAAPAGAAGGLAWTPEALARLAAIPEFVRPMARAGVEQVAREQGQSVVDESLLSAARARFGM